MLTQEVCRLCLSKDNLLWVFDKRLEKADHMKDVILITTGVEIHSKDVISQKICTKCGQDAIKMFQFRQQSLKNDKYLKAQCRELLQHRDLKIPNTNVTIKTEKVVEGEIRQEQCRKPLHRVHPTMIALSRNYPQMQFPSVCLLSDVDPCIAMEMDEVENYFKSRHLNMQKYVRLALRASDKNSPKKCTGPSAKTMNIDCGTPRPSAAILDTIGEAIVVNKVCPINIKLNQSGYSIVKQLTDAIVDGKVKTVCESLRSCSQSNTVSTESQLDVKKSKKRRYSDNNSLSEPVTKKVLSANPSDTTPMLPTVEKNVPAVFKCYICNSVQSSVKYLKKHQIRHSCCKCCKIQFKSIGMKQQNNYSCLVEEALINVSNVEIERVELDINARRGHPGAFITFPPLPGMKKIDFPSKATEVVGDIIEIDSDDESTTVSTVPITICSKKSAPSSAVTITTSVQNYPSVSSVIRPDVRMKDDNVLDSLNTQAPELKIVEGLLTKIRELRSRTDETTQTELPTTASIQVNEKNLTAEFKNLKQLIHAYHIPVVIRKGAISASYNYQHNPAEPKRLRFWNDLTPIDVETGNNSISEYISNSHSSNITSDAKLVNRSQPCDYFINEQSSLRDIGVDMSASSNVTATSSYCPQTKSPDMMFTQTESLVPTPECYTAIQADIRSTTSTHCSSNTQNRIESHVSPRSRSHSLEKFPVQATTPVTDIPIKRHSPNPTGSDQTTPRIDRQSLGMYSLQAMSSTTDSLNGPKSSNADRSTSRNNPVFIPTSGAPSYINSERSPAQNRAEVNVDWNSSNSHYQAITRQDVTDKTVEYVFKNIGDGIRNAFRPESKTIRQNQKAKQHSTKANHRNKNVPATPKTSSSPRVYGKKAPTQKKTSNNNDLFKPPPPYPIGSTLVEERTHSYISGYTSTSNIPHMVDTAMNQQQRFNENYDAFHEYISQLQQFSSCQTIRTAGTYLPTGVPNSASHHGRTTQFPGSKNLPQRSLANHMMFPSGRVAEPFGCHGNEPSSVTFSRYSERTDFVNVQVNPVNLSRDVDENQLPSASYANSFTPAACDTLTDSVAPCDRSKHFASGLIRVRNVCELT